MAWRLDQQLIHGEIDNRTPGRVTGRLWFLGREDEPLVLELQGNAWRDVAGHLLRFTNPAPSAEGQTSLDGLAREQKGVVGDITASRKVKVPDCSMDELMAFMDAGKPFPWHWGNSLHLEWHSERNGRVVIESAHYRIEIDPEAAWTMTEAEETAQKETNGRAWIDFMQRLAGDGDLADLTIAELPPAENLAAAAHATDDDEDDDAPTSAAEAGADAEHRRMERLMDRVQARLDRAGENGEDIDFDQILDEERARLRRENGEPEPAPPTPEEAARQAAWIELMNAAAEDALARQAAEPAEDFDDDRDHPLVARCRTLSERLLDEPRERGWLTDADAREHPLRELAEGVMIASGKLAGALHSLDDDEDWPPDPLFAGDTLVRLKKARGHLRDALAGLDDAAEQGLATPTWLALARAELLKLVAEVQSLVDEVRAVLENAEDADDPDAAP